MERGVVRASGAEKAPLEIIWVNLDPGGRPTKDR